MSGLDPNSTSTLTSGRQPASRSSLLLVAAMLAALGILLSNSIIPNYHEHQDCLKRAAGLEATLEQRRETVERLQGEIDALSDPYYLAQILPSRYNFRWDEKSEAWRARNGASDPSPGNSVSSR
ncbi:MAG: hypothetical protein HPKKFMNG_02452 [Planctomycetes bacterium]|nr:hypothetical protein [Planctomycetota bacterium]HRJ79941.1 hypothetical protein [Planctomycetota bacterium]